MSDQPTDESHIGIWLGLICVALALLPWIPFDLWLRRHHHEYITTEFREALQDVGNWGLLVCGIVGAILGIALYHFFYQRAA
jgi:hypothetical protein